VRETDAAQGNREDYRQRVRPRAAAILVCRSPGGYGSNDGRTGGPTVILPPQTWESSMSAHRARRALHLAILAAAFVGVGCGGYGTRLTFNGGEVYYTNAVSKAEAEKLGNVLVREQFFDATPKTVQLDRDGDTYLFRMVIKPGADTDPQFEAAAKQMRTELSQMVFDNKPVVLHLCDENLKTLRVISGP
jgi:hypothetical protein